jgi:nucleoid DNA-binding protein
MINYVPVKRKSPRDGTMKFYAATAPAIPVKGDVLLPLIEKRSTMASPDVRAFLNAFEFEVKLALSNNQSIRLSQLGSFRPTVSSKGYATEVLAQKAGANAIQKVHARFRPCPAWKALENIPAGTNEVTFALYVPPVAQTTVAP